MRLDSALPPFPEGWFFVCYSHELKPGDLHSKLFMGREIVAFRGRDGTAAVLDAACPHLGAHMGKGGCVRDGAVECPFHKFRFDAQGHCVQAPGAAAPARARASSWHVQEVDGLILAYHDVAGRPPSWHVPALDLEGFSPIAHHHYVIKGHPQETTENGVDTAHLVSIHGYDSVQVVNGPVITGPHLTTKLKMRRDSRGPLKTLGLGLDVEFDVHVWGLGWSMVDIHAPRFGMRVKLWTLATPRDGEFIDLHIALRVKYLESPSRLLPGLGLVPAKWLRALTLQLSLLAYKHDIEQDFLIWQHKQYLPRPQLTRADGPIGAYRRYCRQFYPEQRDDDDASRAAE